MGYDPEPPPGLSELEDRHQLQRLAKSIGYVAVPEALWLSAQIALTVLRTDPCWRSHIDEPDHTINCLCPYNVYQALRLQQEVIERERQ